MPPHLATRTARLNAIRAVLRELGIVIPQGSCQVLPDLTVALSEPAGPVPEHLRARFLSAASEIRQLESMAGSLVAMEIAGHETDAVFRRYDITSDSDRRKALRATQQYLAEEKSNDFGGEKTDEDADKKEKG